MSPATERGRPDTPPDHRVTEETAEPRAPIRRGGRGERLPDEHGSRASMPGGRRELVATVLSDVVAPIAVYYGLRAAGVAPLPALLAGAAVPAVRAVWTLLRHRRLEWFAVLALVLVAASAATTLLTGDERFLLARDGLITTALGLVIIGTLAAARPAMFVIGRLVLARSGHDAATWDERWDSSSRFRHVWRVVTVLWGAGLLVDAGFRVLLAYTLPVDVVPLLHAIQWLPMLLVLQVLTQLYLRRPRHRDLVFD